MERLIPITVPLSPYHIARLGQLAADVQSAQSALDKAQACVNEAVSAIVGVSHNTADLVKGGWSVERVGDNIVCTPSAQADVA